MLVLAIGKGDVVLDVDVEKEILWSCRKGEDQKGVGRGVSSKSWGSSFLSLPITAVNVGDARR